MKILVGCEESQAVTIELRKLGHDAYSCDILPCSGGHPEFHIIADVLSVINGGQFRTQSNKIFYIEKWDGGMFFPDCTFLTCSAEWAYKEPPYHQKLKPNTIFGKNRKKAREDAVEFVRKLYNSNIELISIENPIGKLSTLWKKPTQTIQPYNFGDDASKRTCLWLKGFPKLTNTRYIEPRYVQGKKRWGNQTDSGQNNLPPSKDRSKLRSMTYPGIAKAMAEQWTS